ncbi:hypothetical protein HYT53_00070 [Candidatus Woesearchaeota archaeon]|nr:hypothetical protein [Candidatus Woesearchaeota archaeon]
MKSMQFNLEKLTIGLLAAAMLVIGLNTFQMSQMKINANAITAITGNAAAESKPAADTAGNIDFELDVIPKGMPAIYGKELGVSYDDVSPSNQQKAVAVASQISCEYCCGVDSIIFSDGKAACGCEHSFAMRGLAKYIIKNHGSQYTNDAILEELGKWKTLFFPGPITKKAQVLKAKGIELNYINLASNKYRGAENGN